MYYGGGAQTIENNQSTPLTSEFVSLHLKGRTDGFALKGGDATQGGFKTMYDGPRPIKGVSLPATRAAQVLGACSRAVRSLGLRTSAINGPRLR